MSLLSRILGRDGDSYSCDSFDHEYGPWENLRWCSRQTITEDGIEIVHEYELRRTCEDCGRTDTYWSPPFAKTTVDFEDVEVGLQGSVTECGFPDIEEVRIEDL